MQVSSKIGRVSTSLREVYSLMGLERKGHLGMLARCFIDDSADGRREKFVIAAGIAGAHGEWSRFNTKWRKVLRAAPSIKYFHSKEWRSLMGEFRQFQDKEKWPKPKGAEAANAKRDALRGVIEECRLRAMAVAVLIPAYERVKAAHPAAAEFLKDDPFAFALQGVIYRFAKGLLDIGKDHCIGFVCDDTDKAATYAAIYADHKRKNPNAAQVMRGLVHLDDKLQPGLQAADLIAHWVNQRFAEWDGATKLQRPLPIFEPTLYQISYWDEEYLSGLVKWNTGVDLWPNLAAQRAAATASGA